MNYKNMRYAVWFLMGMVCSVHGMQLATKEGNVEIPQAFIDASPVLKEMQNQNDQLGVRCVFHNQEKRIIEIVIRHQMGLALSSGLPNYSHTICMADFPKCVSIAEQIKLNSLLVKYSQYAQSLRN